MHKMIGLNLFPLSCIVTIMHFFQHLKNYIYRFVFEGRNQNVEYIGWLKEYIFFRYVSMIQKLFTLVRANLTGVTSLPNSNTGGSSLIFSVPFSYFLFIFYLPRWILPDFPSVSSLASLPFLPCCYQTTTTQRQNNRVMLSYWIDFCKYINLLLRLYSTWLL